ncbi:MAG: hypothetical protein RIR11_2639 [Bacteroidota bacterium]|jgi:hypothetical protein
MNDGQGTRIGLDKMLVFNLIILAVYCFDEKSQVRHRS